MAKKAKSRYTLIGMRGGPDSANTKMFTLGDRGRQISRKMPRWRGWRISKRVKIFHEPRMATSDTLIERGSATMAETPDIEGNVFQNPGKLKISRTPTKWPKIQNHQVTAGGTLIKGGDGSYSGNARRFTLRCGKRQISLKAHRRES